MENAIINIKETNINFKNALNEQFCKRKFGPTITIICARLRTHYHNLRSISLEAIASPTLECEVNNSFSTTNDLNT